MIELAVGTRFRYKGNIYKVVEVECDYDRCSKCDMSLNLNECSIMNCASKSREDGKSVCFLWMGYTEYTEGIEDAEINEDAEIAEDAEDMEETMDNVTTGEECCNKEKTLIEEISELKIEKSLKERILNKIASLEKKNDEFAETINKYYSSTRRLERTIVKLAAALADNSDSVIEDQVIHLIDIGTQTSSPKRC